MGQREIETCNRACKLFCTIDFSEPGYYEDGKFGVRIESLVLVTKAQTKVKRIFSWNPNRPLP